MVCLAVGGVLLGLDKVLDFELLHVGLALLHETKNQLHQKSTRPKVNLPKGQLDLKSNLPKVNPTPHTPNPELQTRSVSSCTQPNLLGLSERTN